MPLISTAGYTVWTTGFPLSRELSMALRATHVHEYYLWRDFSKDFTPTLTLPLRGRELFCYLFS